MLWNYARCICDLWSKIEFYSFRKLTNIVYTRGTTAHRHEHIRIYLAFASLIGSLPSVNFVNALHIIGDDRHSHHHFSFQQINLKPNKKWKRKWLGLRFLKIRMRVCLTRTRFLSMSMFGIQFLPSALDSENKYDGESRSVVSNLQFSAEWIRFVIIASFRLFFSLLHEISWIACMCDLAWWQFLCKLCVNIYLFELCLYDSTTMMTTTFDFTANDFFFILWEFYMRHATRRPYDRQYAEKGRKGHFQF